MPWMYMTLASPARRLDSLWDVTSSLNGTDNAPNSCSVQHAFRKLAKDAKRTQIGRKADANRTIDSYCNADYRKPSKIARKVPSAISQASASS